MSTGSFYHFNEPAPGTTLRGAMQTQGAFNELAVNQPPKWLGRWLTF
jgi:hypothetical protein